MLENALVCVRVCVCCVCMTEEPSGDVLVFLPGQEEIDSAAKILEARWLKASTKLAPLQVHCCYLYALLFAL